MEKEIKINIPDGYEIDKENSTFECIKFKPIEKKLPKTWKEYCKTNPRRKGESWIDNLSMIESLCTNAGKNRNYVVDKNLLPNKEYAEAMLALCQLIQLRDCYNDGWVPDWTDGERPKHCIKVYSNEIFRYSHYKTSRILVFETAELRDQFLENFRDLIEIAKPLL